MSWLAHTVVLAFRRMMGTKLYYFAVELVRGTLEYFESSSAMTGYPEYLESLENPMTGYPATGHAMPATTGYPVVGIGLIMQQDLDPDASHEPCLPRIRLRSVVKGCLARPRRPL